MGYDLIIERNPEIKITLKEWQDYILSDTEIEPISEFAAETPSGLRIKINTPNSGLWKTTEYIVPFVFDQQRGSITVKAPDDIVIKKMLLVANVLQAKVVGEEGEEYV